MDFGVDGRVTAMLLRWAEAVEQFWTALDEDGLGCYGPGYIHWGIQSNWNYSATMATLATQPGVARSEHWRERALGALRFALSTHVSGDRNGQNGEQWGHSWISMLGIERAMHGVAHLDPYLRDEDRRALQRVLVSEANWLLQHGHRGEHQGVIAGRWASSGRNAPESNIWAGTLLWRTAQMFPEHSAATAWEERAHHYLLNGISVPADEAEARIVAGRSVSERHVGANYFANYALDHHGYLNVGYMVICVSNVAMLHFDLKRAGFDRPETLDWHQDDHWRILRRFIYSDGRLARIGGDSRVRYAYCQEYLLPSLLYLADRWRISHALDLAARQVTWIEREHAASEDGTFYAARMGDMRDANPHYYTRLESDRACVLAMLLNYAPLVEPPEPSTAALEPTLSGGWVEPEHGDVLHRSSTRLASFSWRAYGLTQAMCQPPDASDLGEWSLNLCPVVRFLGDDGSRPGAHRRLEQAEVQSFDKGFLAWGSVTEGVDVRIDEGARCTDQARTHIAFAALPDGRTCLGLQYVVAAPDRVGYTTMLKSVHLNVANDLFNGRRRQFYAARGELILVSPPQRPELLDLGSRWTNVDGKLGLVALYGGDGFLVDRSPQRRGGRYRSLYVDEVCLRVESGLRRCTPGETLIDAGFAVLSGVGAAEMAAFKGGGLDLGQPAVRGVWAAGADGQRYVLLANWGDAPVELSVLGQRMALAAGQARCQVLLGDESCTPPGHDTP
jgi:hypothetical protein